MPNADAHFEPFLHLADVGEQHVLIAWGGFYFRHDPRSPYGEWRIADDEELPAVAQHPRSCTIGARSEPFGRAVVELLREGRTVARVAWGKQGPELLDHRLALYDAEQRMVFGANTYRAFARMLASSTEESEVRDPWVSRMRSLPATVVSTTLQGPLDWPDATVVSGDAVDVVARLKEESEVPLRSHGSLLLNRALMAAGLVDRLQVTLFPVITGQTGLDPIFQGAADFDLELIENRTLDDHTQELIYRSQARYGRWSPLDSV